MISQYDSLSEAVENHLVRIGEIIDDSHTAYSDTHQHDRHKISRRSRASLIRDYIVFEVTHWVAGDPLLRIMTPHGRVIIQLNDKVFMQFKKMDMKKRVSNSKTEPARRITQQLPLDLEGMPPDPVYIHAGYVLDHTESFIANIYVTYQVGNQVRWFTEIPTSGDKRIINIDQNQTTHQNTGDESSIATRIKERGTGNEEPQQAGERGSDS